MSNIYIQEPPTNGKVLLSTTLGDIDIELWSKEAPKACRNFVQLCLEGYYNGTIFHRIVKGFICQGGDPTGTGMGGESIYGKPFKDEFHQRLRFIRRGLVAMANAGPNDNQSQFFFTLDRADELNKKHTIFGKVAGNTIYNMIRMEDVEVDENDRPFDPPKILKAEVLSNPFDDIEPRKTKQDAKDEKKGERPKSKSKATKNYKLLSFGDEAEEDEEEVNVASKSLKIKSTHDVLNDPGLSSQSALNPMETATIIGTDDSARKEATSSEMVRSKLTKDKGRKRPTTSQTEKEQSSDIPERMKKDKSSTEAKFSSVTSDEPKKQDKSKNSNDLLQDLLAGKKTFLQKKKKEKVLRKGEGRESATLALLAGFQDRLSHLEDEESTEDPNSTWMAHKLQFEDDTREAKDANIRNEDSFDIYDPRNPITKRRREMQSSQKEGEGS